MSRAREDVRMDRAVRLVAEEYQRAARDVGALSTEVHASIAAVTCGHIETGGVRFAREKLRAFLAPVEV